jgi:serine protease Do
MSRLFGFLLTLCLAAPATWAQRSRPQPPSLPAERTKAGSLMLQAFEPVTAATRDSVVSFEVDGKEVALGAVIEASGLVLTKASEIQKSGLLGKLANGQHVAAHLQATDEENDLALVKLNATGLKPIQWTSQLVEVGQWVVTPGIGSAPEAVGIISVPRRKIPPKRALIGVQLDFTAPNARIGNILPGMGAEKAGLKPGDVILAINATTVTNSEQLVTHLGTFHEGQTVQLHVRRDAEELDASVRMMVQKSDGRLRQFNRQEQMNRFGSELSTRAEGFQLALQHDTVLQAWQCGGPLVNLDGKAVGLNIARAGRVASYALPTDLVRQAIEDLKKQMELPVSQDEAPDSAPSGVEPDS